MLWRALANQVYCRLRLLGQIGSTTMAVHVHVKYAGAFEEEMVVDGCHFEPIFKQSGHDGIYLVFQQHEIPHHYVHPAITLRHRDPSAEAKWSGCCYSIDGDLKIV